MKTYEYNGIDLRNCLAVDADCDVIDSTWRGYREGNETHAHVRRMDDYGSTEETSWIALDRHRESLIVGHLCFAEDLALLQLQRKLRILRSCASQGVLFCDAGVFEFWF